MPPKKRTKTNEEVWQGALKDSEKPVIVLENQGEFRALNISSETLFTDMIHPIPKEAFMEHFFRNRALHISDPRGAERIQSIIAAMDNLNPSSILQETSSDNVFVWILDKQLRKIQSIEIDNVETAIALHTAGHATYCRAPPQVEQPMVANMLRGTGMGCGNYDPSGNSSIAMGRGEVEVFMGTSQHTTDWHYDFQENFTLQLSGVKKWTLQQGTVQHPLRGCTPHYKAPGVVESQLKAAHLADSKFQFGTPQVGVNAIGEAMEVVVQPGDMLYFPAGMWHKVETVEPGVSINVSLMATNYAALVSQALHHYLLTKDEWRESVVSGQTGVNGGTALDNMQELLRQLPSEIEKLVDANFAEQILPPIVRDPPKLELVEDNDEEQVEEEEDNDSDEAGTGHVLAEISENGETIQENVDVTMMDEEEQDSEVVDVNDFETDERPAHNCPGKLVVNSLSSLMRMSDITSFYSGSEIENEMTPLYVLNINYAGNEMHESTVRVVFADSNGNLERMIDGKPREEIACPAGVKEPWQECLLYYGFFVWIPNAAI